MATHNPGPWRTGDAGGSVVCDTPIDGVTSANDIQFYGGHLVCESCCRSNARLISAAPELLEALQTITEYVDSIIEGYHDQMELGDRVLGHQFMKLANDAINKAIKEPVNAQAQS